MGRSARKHRVVQHLLLQRDLPILCGKPGWDP
ncbi:hypothetical protein Rm378p146 [Rhodothermus phage RM378]|nr:hypothetical protein Rm378p146 [Rhodothermus phage RM378]